MERLDLRQFGSLVNSLNRHIVDERVAYVVDTAVGSNANAKGLREHLGALRKAADAHRPGSGVEGLEAFVAQANAMKRPGGMKRGGR